MDSSPTQHIGMESNLDQAYMSATKTNCDGDLYIFRS